MDFLGSMISRNVTAARTHEAPAIQPRVTSVFEPVSMESSVAFEEPVIETRDAAAETISAPVEIRQKKPAAIPEIETARPKQVAPPSRPIASRPVPPRPQTIPSRPEVRDAEPARAESHPLVITKIASEAAHPDPAPPPQIAREAEIFVREAATTRTLLVPHPVRDQVETAAASEPMFAPTTSPTMPSAIPTRRAARRLGSIGERPGRDSEAPTIQVTIGRVEVRATTPQPGPARRSPPQGMTIDDYLRKRQGGGSR